jgi:PIN domain nuclease of toxin-antitoxin system
MNTKPDRLSAAGRRAVDSPTQLCLSSISIWEFGLLARKGGFRARTPVSQWIEQAMIRVPVELIPVDFEIALHASQLILPEPDLADVVLAATSVCRKLPLVTADSQLLEQPWLKTIDAS